MTQNKISSLAEIRQRGTREEVEIAEDRQKWGVDDYFTALQELLSEMRARGLITSFYGAGNAQETELGDVIQVYTEEKLSVLRKNTEERELTDEELIAAWGLEEAPIPESDDVRVKRLSESSVKYTREEWENIQAMREELTELFDDKAARTHFRQKHLGEDFETIKKNLNNIAKRIDLDLLSPRDKDIYKSLEKVCLENNKKVPGFIARKLKYTEEKEMASNKQEE